LAKCQQAVDNVKEIWEILNCSRTEWMPVAPREPGDIVEAAVFIQDNFELGELGERTLAKGLARSSESRPDCKSRERRLVCKRRVPPPKWCGG
jgi:hypothetical protein